MGRRLTRPRGTARGIGRSLRLYHGDPARAARMDALYARFLRPRALAFDIGAHVGDRVSSFRRLGARVVAVEPQPGAFRALRLIHGRDAGVTLVQAAMGDAPGRARLHVNTRNPTISTLSDAFIRATDGAEGWEGQDWDGQIDVPMLTLDALVAEHGVPDFIKIDVEGLEDRVLSGLTLPVPALSFEVTTIQRDVAGRALTGWRRWGRIGSGWRWARARGSRAPAGAMAVSMRARIDALPAEANSGDVYAVACTLSPAAQALCRTAPAAPLVRDGRMVYLRPIQCKGRVP
jgi:FkbM family methyltransferase